MKLELPRYDLLLLVTLILALFASVFNAYHLPLGFDTYHNLIVAAIVAFGLTCAFLYRFSQIKIPTSIGTWVMLLCLIIIQPFINSIAYPDYLIFSIGALILTIVLSIALANIKNKGLFFSYYLFALVGFMLLSFGIQLMQMMGYELSYGNFVVFPSATKRFDANFTQPNQAAFMFALAELACLYLYNLNKKKIWIVCSLFLVIGIALTSSRAGLILGVAVIILFNLFYSQSLAMKVKAILSQVFGFAVSYIIGIILYKNFEVSINQSANAIQRFDNGIESRLLFQEQAIYMFKDNFITGYGWGGFTRGAVDYSNELGTFVFSRHSHFFLTQIASELGILGLICLLPITFFIIKNIKFNLNPLKSTCLTAIGIILLYSCSEFPLWNLRFIIIFALFLTLIDDSSFLVKVAYSKILLLLSLLMSILTAFYIFSYLNIYNSINYLTKYNLEDNELVEVYSNIPNTFGMSSFKESVLFYYIPINQDALDEKLSLAERVTTNDLTKRNLFRYARLLALSNKSEESIMMFKASCALNWNGNCENVMTELNKISDAEPYYYSDINKKVKEWKDNFNP